MWILLRWHYRKHLSHIISKMKIYWKLWKHLMFFFLNVTFLCNFHKINVWGYPYWKPHIFFYWKYVLFLHILNDNMYMTLSVCCFFFKYFSNSLAVLRVFHRWEKNLFHHVWFFFSVSDWTIVRSNYFHLKHFFNIYIFNIL